MKEKSTYPIPILLIIFKRRDFLPKILSEIKKSNPKKLYIFQDGPRDIKEKEETIEVRKYVVNFLVKNSISFKINYQEKNLGVALSEVKALDWVFYTNDEKYLVSLEDDIIFDDSLLNFMRKVLIKYENNESFLAVNGINFYSELFCDLNNPFYLSRFFIPWGFGIWRRSWDLFDFDLKDFDILRRKKRYKKKFLDFKHKFYLESYFKLIKKGIFTTSWDLQLTYLAYKYDRYFLTPKNNYCINMGQNLSGSNPFLWKDYKQIEKFKNIFFPDKIKYKKKYDEIYFKNRLRGGWFRLLGIYIYNSLPEYLKKILINFLKLFFKWKKYYF